MGRLSQRAWDTTQRSYFGIKRFDREAGNVRIHVHTFGNLIHANFRVPATDYSDLIKVTRRLTRHHGDVLRVFRRMVFNIAAHNRDDHVKNFAFMHDAAGSWRLTPAYDLTFAHGPGGEHTMTVLGEGRRPTRDLCVQLGVQAGLDPRSMDEIIDSVNAAVTGWARFADQAGCPKKAAATVAAALQAL